MHGGHRKRTSYISEITEEIVARMQHLLRMLAQRCCLRQTALLYFYSILDDHTQNKEYDRQEFSRITAGQFDGDNIVGQAFAANVAF